MASDSTTIDPDVPAPVTDRLPAAVLLVVPLVAAAVSLAASWRFPVTVGDTAWLTQRVADVGAGRWPLVGMPSTIGRGAVATHHPGPLQFYWLAPFWTLAGFRGIVVGTAAAGAAALAWLGVLVRSLPRSSTLAAVGVQVAAVVGLFTISTEMLADPWNPYAALPWLAVLLAAAVAVWNGRRVGWWALVVAASVVAQLHAGYLPLVAGVAAVVAVRTWRRPEVRATRARVPWLTGLAALLWVPPLVDLVAGSHNPWLLTRAMAGGGEPGAGVPIVAAAAALGPAHGTVDSMWLPRSATAAEWLIVGVAVVVVVLSGWVAPRDHWSRSWIIAFGSAFGVWTLLASRAPATDGLIPTAYTRPLWPLASCLTFGVAAAWWARRPSRLAGAWWVPVLVTAVWVLSVPRGYVGLDPATRVRAGQVVADLAAADRLPDRLNVRASGFVAGWFVAPAVTAELDRRGIANGVGTDDEWDVASMTDRPRPLRQACDLQLGDEPADSTGGGPLLAAPSPLTRSELRRLAALRSILARRYPDPTPSRVASDAAAHGGPQLDLSDGVTALLADGRFADLVMAGALDGVSTRDGDVAEYVELAHRADPAWAELTAALDDC